MDRVHHNQSVFWKRMGYRRLAADDVRTSVHLRFACRNVHPANQTTWPARFLGNRWEQSGQAMSRRSWISRQSFAVIPCTPVRWSGVDSDQDVILRRRAFALSGPDCLTRHSNRYGRASRSDSTRQGSGGPVPPEDYDQANKVVSPGGLEFTISSCIAASGAFFGESSRMLMTRMPPDARRENAGFLAEGGATTRKPSLAEFGFPRLVHRNCLETLESLVREPAICLPFESRNVVPPGARRGYQYEAPRGGSYRSTRLNGTLQIYRVVFARERSNVDGSIESWTHSWVWASPSPPSHLPS